jgi:hypothetical protein
MVRPGYFEPLPLYAVAALPSGTRKSSVLEAVTAPLVGWEAAERERLAPEIARAQCEAAIAEARIAHLRGVAAKGKPEERDRARRELAKVEGERVDVPRPPQIWCQDITSERLGALMALNGERLALLSDEGGIFETLAGRYSGGVPNIDLYLQEHSGSPVRVDRGGREPVYLRRPALSLVLSPQPDVLRGLAGMPGFRGRGLLARFLYALPTANVGFRRLDTPQVPEHVAGAWARLVAELLSTPPARDDKGEPKARLLKVGPVAYGLWAEHWQRVEHDMRDGERFEHVRDWAGKLPGAVARIAGLLHVARHAGAAEREPIGAEDMRGAVAIGEALAGHALAVFALMGADTATDGARAILAWVRRERLAEFTVRDCHYVHKGRFGSADEVRAALKLLEGRYYVAPGPGQRQGPGRPSQRYTVNPAALEG